MQVHQDYVHRKYSFTKEAGFHERIVIDGYGPVRAKFGQQFIPINYNTGAATTEAVEPYTNDFTYRFGDNQNVIQPSYNYGHTRLQNHGS